MVNFKIQTVKYVDGNDVFAGLPEAWEELDSSGSYGLGAEICIVSRNSLRETLTELLKEAEPKVRKQIKTVFERLDALPAMFINIANVAVGG